LATDEQHVALPKLYGAPAYARPPRQAEETPRPFDPDELPITAAQTSDERQFIEALPARAYAPGGGVILAERDSGKHKGDGGDLKPRQFRLRSLAGRLLRGNS
jgi:hypothetical protein